MHKEREREQERDKERGRGRGRKAITTERGNVGGIKLLR